MTPVSWKVRRSGKKMHPAFRFRGFRSSLAHHLVQSTCRMKNERILAMMHHAIPIQIRNHFLTLNLQLFALPSNGTLKKLVDPPDRPESCNPLASRASLVCNGQLLVADQITNLGRNWFGQMPIRIVKKISEISVKRCKLAVRGCPCQAAPARGSGRGSGTLGD